MATTSENFINQFHNIQGNNISERKKNLYKILRSSFSPSEKKLLVENLKPTNYLETVFHADVLIYLKATGALLELLKAGNEVYVSKIIKHPWFFQEVFNNVPAKQLVEEVLPTLSYSVKSKVLRKLLTALPPQQIDDIFNILLKRYGLYFATRVLSGCSVEKIQSVLKTHRVILSTYDLKSIHKKDSKLIKTYFYEMNSRNCDKFCENNFYIYLAENDPTLFWEILVNYKPGNFEKLGRRITKKVLPLAEQNIITEPNTYMNYFKQDRIVRALNKQGKFPELYKNLFPNELTDVLKQENVTKILNYYPSEKRYGLFKETFESIFRENIWNNSKFVQDYFLDCMKDTDLRTKWAQLKFKETNNIEYLKYYEIATSIPLLKERINVTSTISDRTNLIVLLLKTCAVNKDMAALGQVLQYYCERHRNEDGQVREKFLDNFNKLFEKKISIYTETIWKYLLEIFTIQLVNKEYGLAHNTTLILRYIEYLYKNNEEIKAEATVTKFFPAILSNYYMNNALKNLVDSEAERKMLLFTCKTLESMKKSDTNTNFYGVVVPWLSKFNKKHCDKKIPLDENIQNLIKKCFETYEKWEFYGGFSMVFNFLCKYNLDEFEQEFFQLLWKLEFFNPEVLAFKGTLFLKRMLHYNPTVMIQYFDNMVKASLAANLNKVRFWPDIRSYSHLGLDDVIKKHCLDTLSNSENSFEKWNCVVALSYFLNTDEYINVIKKLNLYPTKYKLDTENEEETKIFNLQKCFIKMLKNTKEPSQYLSILLEELCRDDFVQDSLPPIYKAFYRLPEKSLKRYLKKLYEKKSMSIQKHTVVLACNLLDEPTTLQTLEMFKQSNNKSLKKAVFSSSLKYFCKNSSPEVFSIILELMKFLTEQDVETLKKLFLTNIDKGYKEEYLQNAWMLLESFKDNSEINAIKLICLKSFQQISISNLSEDFCKNIIKNYFLSDKRFQSSDEINQFIVNFLVSNNKEEHFAFVFEIITAFKSKVWLNYKASDRKLIRIFVKTFIRNACKQEIDSTVVMTFFKFWKTAFTPCDNFEEYLLIKFTVLWKENYASVQFSANVTKYLEEFSKEYEYVFSSFVQSFSEFLKLIDNDKVKFDVFNNLLSTSSTLSCILVIDLMKLEKTVISEDRMLNKYSKIDTKLKQLINNDLVKLKYNSLLRRY